MKKPTIDNKYYTITKTTLNWVINIKPHLKKSTGTKVEYLTRDIGVLEEGSKIKHYQGPQSREIYTCSSKTLEYVIDLADDYLNKYFIIKNDKR